MRCLASKTVLCGFMATWFLPFLSYLISPKLQSLRGLRGHLPRSGYRARGPELASASFGARAELRAQEYSLPLASGPAARSGLHLTQGQPRRNRAFGAFGCHHLDSLTKQTARKSARGNTGRLPRSSEHYGVLGCKHSLLLTKQTARKSARGYTGHQPRSSEQYGVLGCKHSLSLTKQTARKSPRCASVPSPRNGC